MNWNLVLTVFALGLVAAAVIAIIGSVITALQIAKLNAIRKIFTQNQIDTTYDEIEQYLKGETL